jgi:FMN phosphatase YigB (HAD superfamily)
VNVGSERAGKADPANVFLSDVDNTLLDNDAVQYDLLQHLEEQFGTECRQEYWSIFEQLRVDLGYADYLGALQRYRIAHPEDSHILEISSFLIDYPFKDRLYPGALESIAAMHRWGAPVILSDGDAVFQPHKVRRSGLWDAVGGRILIYIHKEQMLHDVERKFPAAHYFMIDDKLRILSAMKSTWGTRLTTVWVKQGHYAADARTWGQYPLPDVAVDRIGDFGSMQQALQRYLERTSDGNE